MTRFLAALAAVITGFLSTFVLPAAAWAEQSGVADMARRGPRIGFFGFSSVLCCLIVVAGIVAVVVLITRRRR